MITNFVEPIKNKDYVEDIEAWLDSHFKNKGKRLIWAIGINIGIRISDILALNVEDVKDKDSITIKEKKTGKLKQFPLNEKLKQLIKDYLVEREQMYSISEGNPLFIGKKHKRLDRSQVYRDINKACKELGVLNNVGTNSMRKTFSYFFYKKYKDLAMLQKILNHKDSSTTLRYIGITQDEIDDAYKGFEI